MFFAQKLSDDGRVVDYHHPNVVAGRRWLVLSHLANLFVDVIVIFMCFPLWFTLYRIPSVIVAIIANEKEPPPTEAERNLRKPPQPSINQRRMILLDATGKVLVDIPFIIMALLCVPLGLGVFRPACLLRDLIPTQPLQRRRRAALQQFCMAIMDIPALFCLAIVTLTGNLASLYG